VPGALVAGAPVANLLSDVQDEAGASFAVDRWLKEMQRCLTVSSKLECFATVNFNADHIDSRHLMTFVEESKRCTHILLNT
jgi:hypothetical protein